MRVVVRQGFYCSTKSQSEIVINTDVNERRASEDTRVYGTGYEETTARRQILKQVVDSVEVEHNQLC